MFISLFSQHSDSSVRPSEGDSPSKLWEDLMADLLGTWARAVRIGRESTDCPDELVSTLVDGYETLKEAVTETQSTAQIGFSPEDPDLSSEGSVQYQFLFAQRFKSRIAVIDMGDCWGLRLEDEEILLRPCIRRGKDGFVVEGVDTPDPGPFQTFNEAVMRLLEGVISTHGGCWLELE